MARQSVGNIKRLVQLIVGDILFNANLVPSSNGGSDMGTSGKRFNNIFCQDLNLANERGDYTVIEESEYLSIKNNKTGKLYKFVLEEISEGE